MLVTKHARERINERMGIPKKSADVIARKALDKGIKFNETTGRLRKYISWLSTKTEGGCNNIRIYAEKVFIFHDEILITVIQIPQMYVQAVRKVTNRKKSAIKDVEEGNSV